MNVCYFLWGREGIQFHHKASSLQWWMNPGDDDDDDDDGSDDAGRNKQPFYCGNNSDAEGLPAK